MSQKEYASLSTLRYFLDNLKTIFAAKTEAVPDCAAADTGQFLRVVDGVAVWQSITDPEDVCIYSDPEVPDDAPEGSLWVVMNENGDGFGENTNLDEIVNAVLAALPVYAGEVEAV